MMGQITNGTAKGERTYILEIQSRYDGSDHEWHGKGIKDIQPEDAGMMDHIANGPAKRYRTYMLKMQSRYNRSDH